MIPSRGRAAGARKLPRRIRVWFRPRERVSRISHRCCLMLGEPLGTFRENPDSRQKPTAPRSRGGPSLMSYKVMRANTPASAWPSNAWGTPSRNLAIESPRSN